MGRKRKPRQQEFAFPNTWGGARKGAGRKPKGEKPGASHRARPALSAGHPVHVVIKLLPRLPELRNQTTLDVLVPVFARACRTSGFGIVHWSILNNHIHLIVEASGRERLSRGMQGLCSHMARVLNRLWGRRGQVFADRYHSVILKTPTQVRHALCYVLHNAKKHGMTFRGELDPFSTAAWFDGWREQPENSPLGWVLRPFKKAGTWLLKLGWRRGRGGLLSIAESPAGARSR